MMQCSAGHRSVKKKDITKTPKTTSSGISFHVVPPNLGWNSSQTQAWVRSLARQDTHIWAKTSTDLWVQEGILSRASRGRQRGEAGCIRTGPGRKAGGIPVDGVPLWREVTGCAAPACLSPGLWTQPLVLNDAVIFPCYKCFSQAFTYLDVSFSWS